MPGAPCWSLLAARSRPPTSARAFFDAYREGSLLVVDGRAPDDPTAENRPGFRVLDQYFGRDGKALGNDGGEAATLGQARGRRGSPAPAFHFFAHSGSDPANVGICGSETHW